MQVHYNIQQLPAFKNAVITIGTFDGVHNGHQQIILQLKAAAINVNGETVVITFHPHPKMIVSDGRKDIHILNTLDEKISLLEKAGIDHLVVVPFNNHFAQQSAEEYITHFLVKYFHPNTIIIGYDHRFGNNRQGDYHLLEKEAFTHHFVVQEIPEQVLRNLTISSTKIREALLQADIETANELLGYAYFFSGKVIEGNKLGRTLGYPTANLQMENENKLVPGNGVYAVEVAIDKSTFKGMMNIGVRPTINGTQRVIEVNIFEFDADIYGQSITVTLCKHLRPEVKFNGLDALKAQLAIDRQNAVEALA